VKNETLGLEGMEISELIREMRIERGVRQEVLYQGLCERKVYFKLENGEVIMDELLAEKLFSRLHVQHRLIDIMLSDNDFWQKECRYEIDLEIKKQNWEKAEELLDEYEERTKEMLLHRQYVMEKRAEIFYQKGQKNCGKMFCEALELTMPLFELENRLSGSGAISEDELWSYMRYRNCVRNFKDTEYKLFLEKLEKCFLSAQIYAEVYFEVAFQYAQELYRTEQYSLCRNVCEKAIEWLKRGIKYFHLAEFYFYDAAAGMKIKHEDAEEKQLFQQCKMAYYVSLSFGEEQTAEMIKERCREEFRWHIIG